MIKLNIKDDSRKIKKGDTFIALKKVNDGHDYILDAIKNGATKIIAEHGNFEVETVTVSDTHKYLVDYLYDNYYDKIKNLKLIGMTGTNGKTTTCFLIYQALNKLNIKLPGGGGGYSEGGNPSVRCGGQLPPSHRPSSLSCAGVAHGLFYEKSILCSFLQNAHASGSLRSPCGYRGAKGTLRRGRGNNGKRGRCRK